MMEQDSQAPEPPSLAALSVDALRGRVRGLDGAIAQCTTQSRELSDRKDSLLVELGVISDSLEELHKCRTQLEELREDVLDEVHERLPPAAVTKRTMNVRGAIAGFLVE